MTADPWRAQDRDSRSRAGAAPRRPSAGVAPPAPRPRGRAPGVRCCPEPADARRRERRRPNCLSPVRYVTACSGRGVDERGAGSAFPGAAGRGPASPGSAPGTHASLSGGWGRVAAGRTGCQRAAHVLRSAPALWVTPRPPRGSDGSYGPCGPAWTGRPGRPRRSRDAVDRRKSIRIRRFFGVSFRCRQGVRRPPEVCSFQLSEVCSFRLPLTPTRDDAQDDAPAAPVGRFPVGKTSTQLTGRALLRPEACFRPNQPRPSRRVSRHPRGAERSGAAARSVA